MICGIASGFAFGYDPTGRSVIFMIVFLGSVLKSAIVGFRIAQ
jgi:hypothetical protein